MFTDEFKKYILIGLSIVLIILIILGAKTKVGGALKNVVYDVSLPVQNTFVTVNRWIKEKFEFIPRMGSLEKENKELKIRNEELVLENNLCEKYRSQNEELKSLLDIKNNDSYGAMITSRIIGVDPNNIYKVLIIDKGLSDGIEKDMIAIHANGLVGRVLEVGKNYSKIITISDDRMTIGVAVERTKERMVLVGNNVSNNGTCKMENISTDVDLLADDEIVTSNVSMLYPEGIKVGKVRDISISSDELSKKAMVDTAVDTDKIEYVMLIKNKQMLEEDIEEVFNELSAITLY